MAKKAVIIVGAGASYDCANGLGIANLDWRPPLARQLFERVQRVQGLLGGYPGAQLIQSTQPQLQAPEVDLERELRRASEHQQLSRAFVDVPPYLRALITRCGRDYLPNGRTETYAQLVLGLVNSGHEVAFVSLNYDSLLEQAISQVLGRHFNRLSDYWVQNPLVIKPHGSVDWFWLHARGAEESADQFRDRLASANRGETTFQRRLAMCEPWAEVFPLAGWMREEANGTRTVLRGQDSTAQTVWLYPAITAPVSNKDRKDLVPPEEHFEKLRAFQVDCAKYLFLGTSGLDDHILRLIGNGCGGERPLLCNVSQGSDSEVGAVTERLAGGLTAGAQRELNFERWQWGGGFNAWVQAVNFSDFLEA